LWKQRKHPKLHSQILNPSTKLSVDPCHMLHAMWCWDYSRQVNIRMENTKRN
jgi:hypothetical protein